MCLLQESTSHVTTPSYEVKDEINVHEDTKDLKWDSLLKVVSTLNLFLKKNPYPGLGEKYWVGLNI